MELDRALSPRQPHLSRPVPLPSGPYLLKRLLNVLEQITISLLDDELENAVQMYFHPEKQNIFSYLGDLRKAVKWLHDLNDRIPEEGRIYLPNAFI